MAIKQQAIIETDIFEDKSTYSDICIICALSEEADNFIKFVSYSEGVEFNKDFSKNNREFRKTIIKNNAGESLQLNIFWPPSYGPVEASLLMNSVLEEFQPRFIAMVGICAGDKRKVKLGDLIIASKAFVYDAGKYRTAPDGTIEHLYDTDTEHPDKNILQYARMFTDWKEELVNFDRPISIRQQRDWLLNRLLNCPKNSFDEIELSELNTNAPSWRQLLHDLQKSPKPYIDESRRLIDVSMVKDLFYGSQIFPYLDPKHPHAHIAPIASGSAVREDNPFKEICTPVRGTKAIDMESYPFYRSVADYPGVRSLLVKGVCDYADREKDDTYHEYAAKLSSAYTLNFVKEYVNRILMPRFKFKSSKLVFKEENKKYSISNQTFGIERIKSTNEIDSADRSFLNFYDVLPFGDEKDDSNISHLKSLLAEARNSKSSKSAKNLLTKAKILCGNLRNQKNSIFHYFNTEILSELSCESDKPSEKSSYWLECIKESFKSSEFLSDYRYDIYFSRKIIDYIQDPNTCIMKNDANTLFSNIKNKIDNHISLTDSLEKAQLLSTKSAIMRYASGFQTTRIQQIKLADESVRCATRSLEEYSDHWSPYLELGLSLWYRSIFDKKDYEYNRRLMQCENYFWESVCLSPNIYNLMSLCSFYRKTYQALPFLECYSLYQKKEYSKRRYLRNSDSFSEIILQLWYSGYPTEITWQYFDEAEYLLEKAISYQCSEARHIINLAFIKAARGQVEVGNKFLEKIHNLPTSGDWTEIATEISNITSDDELVNRGFALGVNTSSVWNKLGTYAIDFLKDIDLGIFLYKHSLRLNNCNSVAMTNLARAYLTIGTIESLKEAEYWIERAPAHANRRFQWWKSVRDQIKRAINIKYQKELVLSKKFKYNSLHDLKRTFDTINSDYKNNNYELEFNRLIYRLFNISLGNLNRLRGIENFYIESPTLFIDSGFIFFEKDAFAIKTMCSEYPVNLKDIDKFITELAQNKKKGIFFSLNGFTNNALEKVRQVCTYTQLILFDGDEINKILTGSPPLDEAIRLKQIHIANNLNPAYSINNDISYGE